VSTILGRSARLVILCAVLFGLAGVPLHGQDNDYRVGARDILNVVVWEQQSLTGKYEVDTSGAFMFPLIGRVQAAGLGVNQIETELRTRLLQGFLKNPQVVVTVADYRSQRVFVIGEVRSPGQLPLTGHLTLLEALAKAGSLTESAGGELIVMRPNANPGESGPILPGHDGAAEILRVGIQEVRQGALPENTLLRDGDTVFVPRAESFYVLGQVNSPGSYTLEKGMTVLRAISLAGGVTRQGSSSRVKILRIIDGKKTEVKAGPNDLVKPGDTIVVPTRLF
jgi:polysaccharide export outer membrane protein